MIRKALTIFITLTMIATTCMTSFAAEDYNSTETQGSIQETMNDNEDKSQTPITIAYESTSESVDEQSVTTNGVTVENQTGENIDTASEDDAKTETIITTSGTTNNNNSVSTQAASKPVVLINCPSKLKATNTGRDSIKIVWSKVKGAKGYVLYRATSKNGTYKRYYTFNSGSKTSFTNTKVTLGKTYYYKIKAYKYKNSKKVYSKLSGRAYTTNRLKYSRKITVKSYAYTGGGITASGQKAKVGRIAVDPRIIPLGTWLYIDGYGICQASDTGGAIRGKVVDLYMNSNGACNRWGVRYKTVYILK